ncbi:hypothetical protein ACJQWK_05183 [Exserohilum turcicum]|uniref:Uncharacterized protein n=1 Tax=Exserohilum turcicum (strain 28A) TaxID=671987 RepID=R0JKG3_EXST2|nr:uncharacterized protein SETTUDRAFT_96855 [Exserohilum turcica Et28A]EOA81788.1 hypothetical protein SETTUDRAFT_96855 [Exserohilum turcica Et28A]
MYDHFKVTGKKVIVSGGARGIGGTVARHLVAGGAHVAVFDILDEPGQAHVAKLNEQGPGKALYFHVDTSKREEVFAAVAKAVDALGGLDSLHNIAGIDLPVPIADITEADVDLTFNVNFKGSLWLAQAAVPFLQASGGGTILNTGSDSALFPFPDSSHYSASKGAIHSLNRSKSTAWAKYNIRVNAVIPAAKTDMYYEAMALKTPEERAATLAWQKASIPLGGELGQADDVAPTWVFLTSDAAKFITGQLISVNGGLSTVR